jgi:hypothetical protein
MGQFSQGQMFIILIVFAVGFLIGAAIAWILAGRDKNKDEEPQLTPEQHTWLSLREQYQEKASLWLQRSTGKLVVRVDGQMLERQDQLSDLQRKNLNASLKEWVGWMGFPAAPASAEPGVKASVSRPTQPSPAAIELPAGRPAPEVKPVDAPAAFTDQAPAAPTGNKPKSIVEQIDEILQTKVKNSPGMQKAVKLVEDPREGVVVWVGLDHFAGVDAVPDPEVKALLKAAAAEWEQRQSPAGKR